MVKIGDLKCNGLHLQKFIEASLHVSVLARLRDYDVTALYDSADGDEEEKINLSPAPARLIIQRRSYSAHPVLVASCLN